nr:hypothetical protein [Eubacterium sp.]
MKEKLIKFLSKIGKKHKKLVVPIMALMVVFLTIYHAIRKFFFDVRYHKARMRTLTALTSLAVVFALIVLPSLAEQGGENEEIVYVEEGAEQTPSEDVKEQTGELAVEEAPNEEAKSQEVVTEEKATEGTPENTMEKVPEELAKTQDDENEIAYIEEEVEKENDDDSITYEETKTPEKRVESSIRTYKETKNDTPLTITNPSLSLDKSGTINATYGKIAEADADITVTATAGDAEGTTTFEYLWKVKDESSAEAVNASGENNKATYSVPRDIAAGTYEFSCVVTATRSLGGKVASVKETSDSVTVQVDRAPLQQTLKDTPKEVLSYDLSDVYYDGKAHGIGATKTSAYDGIGEITVTYEDGEGEKSQEKPKKVGDYTVTVTVAQGVNYEAASDAVTLGTLTIKYWKPEGTYSIDGKVSGTDKESKEWYKESVMICPPSGCLISKTQSDFAESLVYAEGKHSVDKVYFQKNPEGYISEPVVLEKEINIDTTEPTVSIEFEADAVKSVLYRMTGSGSAFRENQKVSVTAEDGASGVKAIYYYSTTEGAVDYRNISDSQWKTYEEFNITATKAESTNYYIYAKAVDYAGNIGYASNEDVVLDSVAPEYSVDGNVISSDKKYVADEKTLKVTDANLATISVKRADSADADSSAASDVLPAYDIIEKDGTKSATVSLPAPKDTGGVYKYFVTAYDASGNSAGIAIVMVDPVSDVTVTELRFADQVYGYEDDSIDAASFTCTKAAGYTEPTEPNITSVEILQTEGTDYEAFTVVDGTKIKPVNRLHAGSYTAKVRIHYNEDSTILSTCSIKVEKAQLNAEYRGQDVWYNTMNPDFSNYIYITGFKYDESPSNPENMPYEYIAPVITNFTGPAVELGVHKMTLGGGLASDYEFAYTDGYMRILRRESDRYSIHGTKGSLLADEDNAYWYTDAEISIVPDEGYMLSQDDTDSESFTEQGFVLDADVQKTTFQFFVKNIATGEISQAMLFTYGKDSTYPEGEIVLKESGVRSFLNTVTFGNFFTDTVTGTINAKDDMSDITSVQYCVSSTPLDDTAIRTYNNWVDGDSFHITPGEAETSYVYAKIVNGAGLVTYVSTDEVVFDTKAPDITGVSNEATYIAEKKDIVVKDEYLAEVTLYEGTDVSGEGVKQAIDASGKTATFSVSAADEAKTYTVVAVDGTGNKSQVIFSLTKPVYEVSMEDKELPTVVYGYEKAPSVVLDVVNTGNAEILPSDINIGNDKQFTLIQNADHSYEIAAVKGLPAGEYSTKITVYYNGMNKVNANYSLTVKKGVLTATYKGEEVKYNMTPDVQSKVEVAGFVNGETPETAAGYETPTVEFAGKATETQVLVPKNGKADNYDFEYVKGVLSVTRNAASQGGNGQYTIQGTKTESGWYNSDITITPNAGYALCDSEDSDKELEAIVLTEDTDDGRKEFYVRNKTTGEVYKKTVFVYMKDVVNPVVTGVDNGAEYSDGEKTVTVTDAYLASVTVNGTPQVVSEGSATFTLAAKNNSTVYVVVARDRAGNTVDKTVIMNKNNISSTDNKTEDSTDLNTDSAGKISKKAVIVSGAPTAGITSSAADVAKAVLDADELKQVASGKNVDITLKVRNIDNTVSQSEKELIIANLQGYTLGQYLDLSVFKSVNGGAEKQVSNLNKNISITLNIPDSLLNTDSSKRREFAMLRVHNGEVSFLGDQDSVANTITVFSKKFSTYALVYKDVKGDGDNSKVKASTGGKKNGGSTGGGGSSSPATGDSAPIIPMIIVLAISFVGIITIIAVKTKMRRKEAK